MSDAPVSLTMGLAHNGKFLSKVQLGWWFLLFSSSQNSSLRHFLFLVSVSVWVDMIDFKNGKCWDLTNGQCGEQTPSNHFHSQDSIFGQKKIFSSKCEEENMNLNQWHDSCGVIDSFEGWLLLRIFKLPHHLSFILAVIIHSRKFTRRENNLNCKHRTYMPTSITGQMISAMKTCKHTDRKMCVQELAFLHVKALPFCPFGPFNWGNMSTK